jgi:hypothetical protein
MKLTSRELATVLASLRTFQHEVESKSATNILGGWGAEYFHDCEPLTVDEISNLCERINCEDEGIESELMADTERLLEEIEHLSVELQQAGNYNTNIVMALNALDAIQRKYANSTKATEDLTATSALLPGVTSR